MSIKENTNIACNSFDDNTVLIDDKVIQPYHHTLTAHLNESHIRKDSVGKQQHVKIVSLNDYVPSLTYLKYRWTWHSTTINKQCPVTTYLKYRWTWHSTTINKQANNRCKKSIVCLWNTTCMPPVATKSKKLFLASRSKSRSQGHWPWCHLKGHH